MWTSPGTLPKVLRLNSSLQRSLFVCALFLAVLLPLSAEAAPGFLVKGPVRITGLPFIYPNALTTYKGYYQYGKERLTVFFTPDLFIIPREWEKIRCGRFRGYRFTDNAPVETSETAGSSVFYYKKESVPGSPGWSVFICFPKKADCGFISLYLTRLEYFQRNNNPNQPPLLPAVVEAAP